MKESGPGRETFKCLDACVSTGSWAEGPLGGESTWASARRHQAARADQSTAEAQSCKGGQEQTKQGRWAEEGPRRRLLYSHRHCWAWVATFLQSHVPRIKASGCWQTSSLPTCTSRNAWHQCGGLSGREESMSVQRKALESDSSELKSQICF